MAKTQDPELASNGINRICAGTAFVGNIDASSDIRIDGVLRGNLTTKGKLVVGEGGSIEGDVVCKNADIQGALTGKVAVSDFLALRSTARLRGDVSLSRILIESGALFVGYCQMTECNESSEK